MVIPLCNRCILAVIYLLSASVLAGCEKPVAGVNLHAVNYSGDAFRYYVTDPAAPKAVAGGELIEPFAAGGTTCCFALPKKWRPGIKVQIRTTHWLPERPDGSLPEVTEVHLVEVPAYVESKPGELWVVRGASGGMSVISSDFQPDHPKWPGTPKGWPVPSVEYQRERWELYKYHQEGFVEAYVDLLDKLEKTPRTHVKEAWEHASKYEKSSLKGFFGPDDPRYIIFLKEDYTQGLKRSREKLKKIMEMRP
jgi:Protein of unknown function (DUF3304)